MDDMNILRLAIFLTISAYSLQLFAKTIIISDIDDTIKKANSMGTVTGAWHFLRKKPYEEMRDVIIQTLGYENSSSGDKSSVYYVSAAPRATFDGEAWIKKHGFPSGKIFLKTMDNRGNTYDYKMRTIRKIIQDELRIPQTPLRFIFIGDNSSYDPKVYTDTVSNFKIDNHFIMIRDVSTEATYFDDALPVKQLPGIHYFFSEKDLLEIPYFHFVSEELRSKINEKYKALKLIPTYTKRTLFLRLKALCPQNTQDVTCVEAAKENADLYWERYHQRH